MYYEEEVINGILHYRTTPEGEWTEHSKKGLTDLIVRLRDEHTRMSVELVKLTNATNEIFKIIKR